MKKGVSFERIVIVFVVVLLIIFVINALDPGYVEVFNNLKFDEKNNNETKYIELKEKSKKASPLNLTVFIDPSSRIDNKGVIERDTSIIKEAISQFLCRTYGTKVETIKQFGNHLQVIYFSEGDIVKKGIIDNFNRTINNYNECPNNLSLWDRICDQKPGIEPREYTMDSLRTVLLDKHFISEYYNQLLAANAPSPNGRVGSDIYGLFDKHLFSKNVIRRGSRNILFILTDGWVDYKPTRRDFDNSKSEIYYLSNDADLLKKRLVHPNLKFHVPHDYKNDSLEIYVFGLSKSGDTHENNELHKLWEDWLFRMVGKGKYYVYDFNTGNSYDQDIFNILNPENDKH